LVNKDVIIPSNHRDARHFNTVKSVSYTGRFDKTYCFTEPDRGMGVFNGIITGNCQEITLPTEPIESLDDINGEISMCILSAINLGKCKAGYYEIQKLADLCVRSLDALIDYQDYPVIAAELATKSRRSLGVGFIGVAHMFARHGYSYNDREAATLMHEVSELLQFYLLKASCQLAQEKGPCSAFKETKYSKGILPIDTYKKEVDEVHDAILHCDWESLRKEIVEHGLRNSTLTAQMPSESSSVVSNATNGIEPPRAYISVKKSKMGPLKQVVPQYSTLKNNYTLLWDIDDLNGYLNVVGVQQKFTDQSISANTSYNPLHYGEDGVPLTLIINHLLRCYSLGIKTLYYHNTYDLKGEDDEDATSEQTVPDVDQMLADALECDDTCDSCSI
jgi:ribonucleoside-diphosphate reductase alpha chain